MIDLRGTDENRPERGTLQMKTPVITTEYMHEIRVKDEHGKMLPVTCPLTLEYPFQRYDPERNIVVTPLYDRYLVTLGDSEYTLTREQLKTALGQGQYWRDAVSTYKRRALAIDEPRYDRIDGLIPGGVVPWPVVHEITARFDARRDVLADMEIEESNRGDNFEGVPGTNAAFDIEGGSYHYHTREETHQQIRDRIREQYHAELVKLAKQQMEEN